MMMEARGSTRRVITWGESNRLRGMISGGVVYLVPGTTYPAGDKSGGFLGFKDYYHPGGIRTVGGVVSCCRVLYIFVSGRKVWCE